MNKETKGLFDFIENSPSQFHAVEYQKKQLLKAGYTELFENVKWSIKAGGKYFVTRNGSSIAAFRIPKKDYKSFMIMASHSDSPTFRIKENPEITDGNFVKLNVEKYGGMLMAPWFDRPLSIAGRVLVKNKDGVIESQLVDVDKDLVMITNLAIHFNREANDGYKYNAQKDLLPILSMDEKQKVLDIVADSLKVKREDIVGNDLFLYNRQKGSVWGAEDEFISIGRIDDLQCAYSSLEGFLAAGENKDAIALHIVFDNEEVGSGTKQGADSTFLYDIMVRINEALKGDNSKLMCAIAGSFMLSADNAHSYHPNYPEKYDPTNRVYMNKGIVMKFNANQKYTTDGASQAIFVELCKKAKVPYQVFYNRSDVAGGSTLGNISNSHVSLNAVDIGVAQLAMHSPYETAGAQDTKYLIKLAAKFYESALEIENSNKYTVK